MHAIIFFVIPETIVCYFLDLIQINLHTNVLIENGLMMILTKGTSAKNIYPEIVTEINKFCIKFNRFYMSKC